MKKMTGFATKVLTLVLAAALVLGTCGRKVSAADELKAFDRTNGVVFSIAKGVVSDQTTSFKFQGLDRKDYYQIHSSVAAYEKDRKEASNKTETYRYSISVASRGAISFAIGEAIEESELDIARPAADKPNVNETNGTTIEYYNTALTAGIYNTGDTITQNTLVEATLDKLGILSQAESKTETFVKEIVGVDNLDIAGLTETQKEVIKNGEYKDSWYIDWYVIKAQDNGVHVDGVMVIVNKTTSDPVDPKDPADPTDPVDPKDPADPTDPVDPKDPADPTDPVDPKDPADPTDPVDPKDPADPTDPVDPKDPVDPTDPVDPKDPVDPTEPEKKEEPVVPFIIIPSFIDDEPEEPVAEEIPVDEPKTPEAAPEEEEIPVEEPGTPEGAPVEEEPEEEEIPVEVPTTPEGAPEEEEEEDIDVEIPETPEGDVLPQTGVASAAVFFGFGAGFIAIGAAVIGKFARKEEI
ncbi:MAG: LPXTG cell wall anchor domain-containing protein [Lachnospiraceae bacterium]|nr:LPXTG cell wall anchor domain-containing protein [Lachnospiraceae bacterium]